MDRNLLGDAVVEADEVYVNAGAKRHRASRPGRPPRRRANRWRAHGTFATDRPPIAGVIGRESGEVRLDVIASACGAELEEVLDDACLEEVTIHTDEWAGRPAPPPSPAGSSRPCRSSPREAHPGTTAP
jgi:hypothetical protein